MNILSKVCAIPLTCLIVFPTLAMGNEIDSLVIDANSTYTVTKAQNELFLKKLTVGDNAVIQFDPDVVRWHLQASSVSMGNGVVINASGLPGDNGTVGKSATGVADDCGDGKAGDDGGHGSNGTDGVAISMRLAISDIGSLTINAAGGKGGVGGRGGAGQQAGKVIRCTGPDGGAGGQGGEGGDGGNGSYVRIVYSYVEGATASGALGKFVTVDNVGGVAGSGASGGHGGGGAEGKYINMRTLTGSKKWMPAGQSGVEGRMGKTGRIGVTGQALLERDLEGRMTTFVQSQAKQQDSAIALQQSMLLEQKAAAQAALEAAELSATELAKVNAELLAFKQQSLDLKRQLSKIALSSQAASVDASAKTALAATESEGLRQLVGGLQAKITILETSLAKSNEQLMLSNEQFSALSASVVAIQAEQKVVQNNNASKGAERQKMVEQLIRRLDALEERPAQKVIEKVIEKVAEKAVGVKAEAVVGE
ncbi:hypothetical protein A9Q81_12085 [Gammaproteobacteria bacterium 42_54_T18]|nr:hypothetical protein A9Q81_12085 [Gammaproteobacteria bacterium 42_54_T18]